MGTHSPRSLRPLGSNHSLRSVWCRRQTCSGARVDAKRMEPLQMRKLVDGYCSVGSLDCAMFFVLDGAGGLCVVWYVDKEFFKEGQE